MMINVDEKLKKICKEIKDSDKTLQEWMDTETSNQFDEFPYAGGFEAIEQAFWFSYYADDGDEYVFRIDLDEIESILSGNIKQIKTRDDINIFDV
jgi:hypothetical protein